MSSTVPGFDAWMSDLLVAESAAAGETPDQFVGRAVAARIAAERARRGEHGLPELLDRMHAAGLQTPVPAASGTDSAIADPQRLQALYDSGMLNAERTNTLDRVVDMVAAAVAVPGAAVTLVDRDTQYVCSGVGLTGELEVNRRGPVRGSLGAEVVVSNEPLIIDDARGEPLLRDHYAVRDGVVVAYAGFPLKDGSGHTIGTLSAWDPQPRRWTSGQVQVLEDFVAMIRARIFGIAPD
ncbi:GAF domain-containing protein [Mycobacterium sp. ITM-2016-00317]|uniref:GAF domain-containing protein n=1 Tax=Mycobacterium sp. ITM-2016-00317 TaxID=2099694 RepID=UPI00287F5E44|nr:GAF domain-containing protein [Mycobacterium sp. ITM-2016-00317]WNG89372.1 GAF domain-containing protein [Mycobacterium sp. ITM-2016-00317]